MGPARGGGRPGSIWDEQGRELQRTLPVPKEEKEIVVAKGPLPRFQVDKHHHVHAGRAKEGVAASPEAGRLSQPGLSASSLGGKGDGEEEQAWAAAVR